MLGNERRNMNASWKTTASGVASILAGLGILAECAASGNWDTTKITAAFAAISTGIGLLFARDNDVTSRQAGAE